MQKRNSQLVGRFGNTSFQITQANVQRSPPTMSRKLAPIEPERGTRSNVVPMRSQNLQQMIKQPERMLAAIFPS